MALVLADRVRETTTTTGTGSVTLAGAYTGFQTFSAGVGNTNSTYYTIANVSTGEYEVGIGTYSSGGNLLSRTTVLASSNGGALVNFSAGTKDAFVTQPAERALYIASAGTGLESKVTAFTNGGIVYASSTSALATGSALVFDGTNLGLGGTNNSYGSQTAMTLSGTNVSRIDFRSNSIFTGTILSYQAVTEGLRLQTEAGYPITFYPAGTEAMRIGVATGGVGAVGIGYTSLTSVGNNGLAVLGNVGIGTSSPAYKLEVATGTEASGQVAVANFRTASTTASYNAGIQIYATASATAGSRAVSAIWDADGANSGGGDYFIATKNGNSGTIDFLQYSNASMRFGTNYTNRASIDMTLDASGNFGIGGSSTGSKLYITATNPTATFKATTTGYPYAAFVNDGGDFYVGRDSSAGGAFGYAYSNVIWGTGAYSTVFGTNNQLRMTLDANGNLGLGTSSPSTYVGANGQLVVYGAVGTTFTNNPTNVALVNNGTIAAGLGCGINFAMNYNGSIVTTYGAISCIRETATSGNEAGALVFGTRTFGGGVNMEKMRLDSSGNLLVGATSPYLSEKFNVTQSANQKASVLFNTNASFTNNVLNLRASRNTSNSTYGFLQCSRDGVADVLYIQDSGNVINTNNSYGQISDIKLKENIVDATPKLEKLNQVRVVNFNFIGDQQKQLGVIAQELEQVFPGMIDESPDRDAKGNDLGTVTKSVKYSVFVPMLIKAMQELKAEFDAYKASHP